MRQASRKGRASVLLPSNSDGAPILISAAVWAMITGDGGRVTLGTGGGGCLTVTGGVGGIKWGRIGVGERGSSVSGVSSVTSGVATILDDPAIVTGFGATIGLFPLGSVADGAGDPGLDSIC